MVSWHSQVGCNHTVTIFGPSFAPYHAAAYALCSFDKLPCPHDPLQERVDIASVVAVVLNGRWIRQVQRYRSYLATAHSSCQALPTLVVAFVQYLEV